MPLDLVLAAEVRDWLTRAKEDLLAADRLLTGDPELPSLAAFHAQQAAEKTQKAFLTLHSRSFTRSHDLSALGELCVAVDASLSSICLRVGSLSAYAVEARYPGAWPRPTLAESRAAMLLAQEIFDAVLARVPNEVNP